MNAIVGWLIVAATRELWERWRAGLYLPRGLRTAMFKVCERRPS